MATILDRTSRHLLINVYKKSQKNSERLKGLKLVLKI